MPIDQSVREIPPVKRWAAARQSILKAARPLFSELAVAQETPRGAVRLWSDASCTLYRCAEGIAVELHPCGVRLYTLRTSCRDEATVRQGCEELMRACAEEFAALLGEQPDLFLRRAEGIHGICCLYLLGEGANRSPLNADWERILDTLPVRSVCREREGVSVLFTGGTRALSERALGLIGASGLRCGLCGPYERAAAQACCEKAKMASREASEGEVKPFEDCRQRVFWREAARVLRGHGLSSQDFCHPALARILDYDASMGTDFFRSFKAFLERGGSLRESAALLGVHRNTMAYRMERIRELFSVSPGDPESCVELLFSLHARTMLPGAENGATRGGFFFRPAAERLMWAVLRGESAETAPAEGECRLLLFDIGRAPESTRDALVRFFYHDESAWAVAFDEDVLFAACDAASSVEKACHFARQNALSGIGTGEFPSKRLPGRMDLLKRLALFRRSLHAKPGLYLCDGQGSVLFFLLLQSEMDLTPFCCDEVLRVMDYDYEKGTTLSASLYAYLTSFMNLKNAAARMGIHRNTMDYQVKKIMEIIGGESNLESLLFEMTCTYRILSTMDSSPRFL